MGIGIECQNVTFYALIALWFTEKEHGMASAVSAMMMRMGMVSAEYSTPIIMQATGNLVYPFSVTGLVALLGFFCGVVVVVMDYKN